MNLDEFSKQLIERALIRLDEKGKCNGTGAGTSCPLHGDADCNSSKQNRAEEFTVEGKNKEGKEQGADGKACWKGYKYAGTENGKDKCVKTEEVEKAEKDEKDEGGKHKEYKHAKGKEEKGEKKTEKEMKEAKDLPGNQEKIDANKNGKVDAGDFAILRNRKSKKTVKEMWEKAVEVAEGKKTTIEVMPTVDTPNDPEPPKSQDDLKKKEKKKQANEHVELEEKKLSKAETAKKEKFVKGMKKKFSSFKSKYGNRAKDVMYGTATAMAKRAA
jgi:hypothetical protein